MKTSRWCMAVFCLCTILFLTSCKKRFKVPQYSQGTATIIVPEPADFACYILHETNPPQSGQRKIKVKVNVTSTTISNVGFTVVDDVTVEVHPSVNPFPLSVTINVATNLDTKIETYIVGLECSECANGHGGGVGATAACPPYSYLYYGQIVYEGAKPRWSATERYPRLNPSSFTLRPAGRMPNVPNSCGCLVY